MKYGTNDLPKTVRRRIVGTEFFKAGNTNKGTSSVVCKLECGHIDIRAKSQLDRVKFIQCDECSDKWSKFLKEMWPNTMPPVSRKHGSGRLSRW